LAGQIEILVRDQGIGIAPEVLPTLFQLRAAEARANAGTGAGLGLYLAREQAIALGGDLHLVANQSGGACFCLRLPISFSASASR
jgi:signal transduction histidine kinase